MLCLGLDPKSDISQLSAQISHLYSSNPDSTPLSRNESVTTPISHSHTLKLAVTPTPSSSVKSNTSTPNVSQNKSLSASGRRGHFRIGSLVTLLNSPRTPRPFQDEGKKKSREHYLKPPTVAMVITGCHALLQFTGGRDEMEHSLIETGTCTCDLHACTCRMYTHAVSSCTFCVHACPCVCVCVSCIFDNKI